jgi:hypothetical protein
MSLQVESDRAHVADHLLARLLEREDQATLAALAGRIDQRCTEGRLAGAGEAGDQHAGALEVPADTEHRVEARDAGRDDLVGDHVAESDRRDRQHTDALIIDQERIFVGTVRRAAILDDPQATRRDLVLHAVVEQDHAVGDIFLDAVARQLSFTPLGRDDRRDAAFLQPCEEPPQFGAQDRRIGQAREQGLDGVEDDALRAADRQRMIEAYEQAFEVVLAALLDLRTFDAHVIDDELARFDQSLHVVAERRDVRLEIDRAFLEAHEDAGFVEPRRAVDDEGHREQRLAAAGRAT